MTASLDLAPDLDRSDLLVLLDVRHPLAYLALGPTIGFGRELGLEVDWLPLRVPPLRAPSPPGPEDDRGVRHRRYRAQAIAREIETYAAVQGIELHEPYRDAEAPAVVLAWLFVREKAPEALPGFLEQVFAAYWRCALDVSDPEALVPFVVAAGGEADRFREWVANEGPSVVEATAAALAERGLRAVPGYLVAGEFFQGRQHLPMIRWLLSGREGPGPI